MQQGKRLLKMQRQQRLKNKETLREDKEARDSGRLLRCAEYLAEVSAENIFRLEGVVFKMINIFRLEGVVCYLRRCKSMGQSI
jgi:hypothetical protein